VKEQPTTLEKWAEEDLYPPLPLLKIGCAKQEKKIEPKVRRRN
jgi:hypothetical protein